MAVYVRGAVNVGNLSEAKVLNISNLSDLTHEDRYETYTGCEACGYPLKPHQLMTGYRDENGSDVWVEANYAEVPGKGGCPGCGAGEKYYSGCREVPLASHNPRVGLGDDGSLSVLRGEDRLGYYPQGAWVSYRSD